MLISVFSRSASPHHGFTIMNRLSTENLVEPINKDLEFQLQDPFLLYRKGNCEYYVDGCSAAATLYIHSVFIIDNQLLNVYNTALSPQPSSLQVKRKHSCMVALHIWHR